MLLLDTSAVSLVMRRDPEALRRLRAVEPRQVLLSSPVAAEIGFGLARLDPGSRRRELLASEYEQLRAVVSWFDWTEQAASVFGREKARLQSAGTRVDDMDLAIASIAIAAGARLATSNLRHFERIAELSIDDWGGGSV